MVFKQGVKKQPIFVKLTLELIMQTRREHFQTLVMRVYWN